MTPNTRLALARNLIPAVVAFLAYAATLALSLRILAAGVPESRTLGIAISLAPMIPGLVLCWFFLRVIRRVDEMHRRIQLEAIAFSFVATALVTFGYGFLENVGFPRVSAFIVLPLMCGFWVAGVFLVERRYR